jgi:hypothetical protein
VGEENRGRKLVKQKLEEARELLVHSRQAKGLPYNYFPSQPKV